MSKPNKSAGFSIVEVITAMVLFGIAVLVVAAMANTLTQMNDSTKDTIAISSAVQNKIESLRSKGYNGVDLGIVDFTDELPISIPLPRSAKYEVTQAATPTKEVVVTITSNGQQHIYKTFIGELGVAQY